MPREIRDLIYHFVLTSNKLDGVVIFAKDPGSSSANAITSAVCKVIGSPPLLGLH